MSRTPRAQARISCVEIAIKAQAKRFLAHPVVVQQLEAIWAGSIVFHSAADTLHRKPRKKLRDIASSYGTIVPQSGPRTTTIPKNEPSPLLRGAASEIAARRSVTLYDPSESSMFKLSRLRVPRYRQFFAMIMYATMLGLFLAVLNQRSLDITALEILFWFWGAGYMLDEVVGFTEQGFSLYIMSFWNVFDIGILLLFIAYYILRLYGILAPDVSKVYIANMAYDVLASTAVLLFPRLFSVLDHYRYFSQLLIAFRMMAVDLVAVLLLIVICCSGFFVAFTMSFTEKDTDPSNAAYALFQLVMGFTPAAWEMWTEYNFLGKALLSIFLIICHFLIVTILITVLTNSFMAIVANANEEHQFLFAVNTISMVKSDALFSYIPPTNIVAWLLTPLRPIMPFRRFVWLNRTIIKITHVPFLFLIFVYERLILSRTMYEPDYVEMRGRTSGRVPAFTIRGADHMFSPGARLREPSVTTFHKDRALDEVFRRPFRNSQASGRGVMDPEGDSSSNVVQDWMRGVGRTGGASPPMEQPRSIVERLETRRPGLRRLKTSQVAGRRRDWGTPAKPASDPAEDGTQFASFSRQDSQRDYGFPNMSIERLPEQTDADGDDELATNDDDDRRTTDRFGIEADSTKQAAGDQSSIQSPAPERPGPPAILRLQSIPSDGPLPDRPPEASEPGLQQQRPFPKREKLHARNSSAATILFSPLRPADNTGFPAAPRSPRPSTPKRTKQTPSKLPGAQISSASGSATPGRSAGKRGSDKPISASRPRLINQAANQHYSTPNLATFLALGRRKPSNNAMALDLASELGDNKYVPNANILGAMPISLGTQLENAPWPPRRPQRRQRPAKNDGSDENGSARLETATKMNRMMIERMSHLEEGFREVLREVKRVSRAGSVEDDSGASVNSRPKGKRPLHMGAAASRRQFTAVQSDDDEQGEAAGDQSSEDRNARPAFGTSI